MSKRLFRQDYLGRYVEVGAPERPESLRINAAMAALYEQGRFSGGVVMHTPASARAQSFERIVVRRKTST